MQDLGYYQVLELAVGCLPRYGTASSDRNCLPSPFVLIRSSSNIL